MDFSFSGVKTSRDDFSLLRTARAERPEDLARAFQEAVVEMLVKPTIAPRAKLGADTIARPEESRRIRDCATRLARQRPADGPPAGRHRRLKYCTEQCAMIALAGSYRLTRGERDPLSIRRGSQSRAVNSYK